MIPGYRSATYISPDHKINVLARMLAGYDEATWGRLKENRKRTYLRAGASLLFAWDDIVKKMAEFESPEKYFSQV